MFWCNLSLSNQWAWYLNRMVMKNRKAWGSYFGTIHNFWHWKQEQVCKELDKTSCWKRGSSLLLGNSSLLALTWTFSRKLSWSPILQAVPKLLFVLLGAIFEERWAGTQESSLHRFRDQRFCMTAATKAHLYTTFEFSHWTEQRRHKATPVCHFMKHASIVEPKEVTVIR